LKARRFDVIDSFRVGDGGLKGGKLLDEGLKGGKGLMS